MLTRLKRPAVFFTSSLGAVWLLDRLTRQPPFTPRSGTALITGASSGIGAAFARRLALEGHDLILVARREEKLAALAEDLQRHYGVRAEVLPADLSDPAAIERVAACIHDRDDLVLLVNNAGFGLRGPFWETGLAAQQAMLRLHVQAVAALTHAALPGMLARSQGGIINVASLAAFTNMTGSSNYGATKAYQVHFTETLANELAGRNLSIQALCPGLTRSGFHDTPQYVHVRDGRYPSRMWLTSDEVAAQSLAALRAGGPVVFVPGRFYTLIMPLLRSGLLRPALRLLFRFWKRW